MKLKDIVYRTRSYRRFDESCRIDRKTLEDLVDLARMSASAANRQPLKYFLYNTTEDCARIFPNLAWAGYLKDWIGPERGERPSAYIIIAGDKKITESFNVDHGIAAQSIMLGATEAGFGGCMIASVKRQELSEELQIASHLEILLVLALGKPIEKVVIEDVRKNEIKYWRDENCVHHVPKRRLDDLILNA